MIAKQSSGVQARHDIRYAVEKVVSYRLNLDAIPLKSRRDLLQADKDTRLELMSFSILKDCCRIGSARIRVLVAGLIRIFAASRLVPCLCSCLKRRIKLMRSAWCARCLAHAKIQEWQLPRYDDPVVIVGASELYEARCRLHTKFQDSLVVRWFSSYVAGRI